LDNSQLIFCVLYIFYIQRVIHTHTYIYIYIPGADKSLALPARKQARKHVTDARDFNIETRAVIKFFFLQGKVPKEIHAILTEILACFFPGWAKDLSAPLYIKTDIDLR